jgi:hypothetical protein
MPLNQKRRAVARSGRAYAKRACPHARESALHPATCAVTGARRDRPRVAKFVRFQQPGRSAYGCWHDRSAPAAAALSTVPALLLFCLRPRVTSLPVLMLQVSAQPECRLGRELRHDHVVTGQRVRGATETPSRVDTYAVPTVGSTATPPG